MTFEINMVGDYRVKELEWIAQNVSYHTIEVNILL